MTINQGLSSLVNSSPNFSNQGVENSVNDIMLGFALKSQTLDTAIENNTVLTVSQKNDVKDTINNISYLNVGRYTGDLVRHTSSILNGTIVTINDAENETTATFLEVLNHVQSLQSTIPNFYGVTAKEKSRSVDDHFGTLKGILTQTEDSSKPVITSLKESITFINNASLGTDTLYQTACQNLIEFLAIVVGDSTDFQQTLNTYATAVATAATNFNTTLQSEPYATKRTQIIADRDTMNTQVSLETSNLSGIRTYTSNLTDTIGYTSVADNSELADLLAKTSQTSAWIDYFENYKTRQGKLNPIYGNISTDSDKESIIDEVLKSQGLPDVLDYVDLEAVANKAKKDLRIDTAVFDSKTAEQIITASCDQLGITTANRSIYNQSKVLLNSMNKNDRLIIANALDDNEATDTIS